MLTIKILGPGCANCKRLEEIARKAAADANIEAQIVKVVINEKLVSSGRIPSPGNVVGWLKQAAGAT